MAHSGQGDNNELDCHTKLHSSHDRLRRAKPYPLACLVELGRKDAHKTLVGGDGEVGGMVKPQMPVTGVSDLADGIV